MRIILSLAVIALAAVAFAAPRAPQWKALPQVEPQGELRHTGSHTVRDRDAVRWTRPRFTYDPNVSTGRKLSRVIVLIYDPIIEKEGGRRFTEIIDANDPVQYSHILVDVIRQASWGYINYEIADFIRVDGWPRKVDGFRYDDDSWMEVRRTQQWQPAPSSYRNMIEENNLMERIRKEDIREIWVWGAGGMHIDEFAGFIPNRYARFGPTDNPWLYRPYDIPPEMGKTFWMMGFNYEVGPDNMIHSYVHRVESMALLAVSDGIWDTHARRDPWNVFSWLEMDHPGSPSSVGNCHVPPNGQAGYDYNNPRRVLSWADNWNRFPDLSRGEPRYVGADEWGNSHFGYMKWILERLPKFPGYTRYGYNNWWVYIANTDENLPEYRMQRLDRFRLPPGMPAPRPRPRT
jgi:hypothetical protein